MGMGMTMELVPEMKTIQEQRMVLRAAIAPLMKRVLRYNPDAKPKLGFMHCFDVKLAEGHEDFKKGLECIFAAPCIHVIMPGGAAPLGSSKEWKHHHDTLSNAVILARSVFPSIDTFILASHEKCGFYGKLADHRIVDDLKRAVEKMQSIHPEILFEGIHAEVIEPNGFKFDFVDQIAA
jgi:hypothetical protein